ADRTSTQRLRLGVRLEWAALEQADVERRVPQLHGEGNAGRSADDDADVESAVPEVLIDASVQEHMKGTRGWQPRAPARRPFSDAHTSPRLPRTTAATE